MTLDYFFFNSNKKRTQKRYIHQIASHSGGVSLTGTESENMRFVFFAMLFVVGASFASPQSNLLDLSHSSVIPSIVGVVDSVPSLLDDPAGAYQRENSNYVAQSSLIFIS